MSEAKFWDQEFPQAKLRARITEAEGLLTECRTLVAVVADANARAPGKREMARDLLSKIDSFVAAPCLPDPQEGE